MTEIEICINPLIEALSIFGSAGGSMKRKFRYAVDGDGDGDGEVQARGNGQARIDGFLGPESKKGAGMRMSYRGRGYPLELVMYARRPSSDVSLIMRLSALRTQKARLQRARSRRTTPRARSTSRSTTPMCMCAFAYLPRLA
jgi:hypothetical protein